MSRPTAMLLGVTGVVLLLLVTLFFFFRHLVTKSFPVTRGSVSVPAIAAPVGVHRDMYGVPHVKAAGSADLMFAAGYVHAQDRLWQMDLTRRAGEGRLSELFGEKTLGVDRLFRTLNLPAVAETMETRMDPDARAELAAYAAGVNAFLGSHEGALPVEFDMLDYRPYPWTVRHSLVISRLIAWELALAWWTDLTYGAIARRVSPDQLREILPGYPDSVRVTVPGARGRGRAADLVPFLAAARTYREMFGLGYSGGSNAWAVSGSRSQTGYPLLANDPHLAMPQPSRWYLMHLSSPGLEVTGVTIPGIPVVVIGHTDRLAWGFTNAMLDDADFYVERTDTADPGYYLYEGRRLPFTVRTETIRVGREDSVEVSIRSTHHGPVVNDVHPVTSDDSAGTGLPLLTMRWTGLEPGDDVAGFLALNRAKDMGEFERALSLITAPGQAVLYADTAGNVAYWTTGRVPVRGRYHPMLPLPGWTRESEWKGYVPFGELPRLVNPPDGLIALANQKIAADEYPHFLSTLWEPPSRIVRIRRLLEGAAQFTADDFKRIQQDLTSPYAKEMTDLLREAVGQGPQPDSFMNAAVDYLRNWDHEFSKTDVATTIFNCFYVKLLENVYMDEMGEDLFANFVEFGAIPNRVTSQLLLSDTSLWFDDAGTPQRETGRMVLRESLADALEYLRGEIGPVMKEWQWGRLHTVTFRHPFGSREPLGRVFDVGPFEVGGGGTTVFKAEFNASNPFGVKVGPSMRQIIDLSKPLEGLFVLTGGQSGQAFHDHYKDQSPLWLNGGYLRLTSDWEEIDRSGWDLLTLEPAG